jgi:hypothetical protein
MPSLACGAADLCNSPLCQHKSKKESHEKDRDRAEFSFS